MDLPAFTKSMYSHKLSEASVMISLRAINKVGDIFTDEEISEYSVDKIFDTCVERRKCCNTKSARDRIVFAVNNYKRFLREVEE